LQANRERRCSARILFVFYFGPPGAWRVRRARAREGLFPSGPRRLPPGARSARAQGVRPSVLDRCWSAGGLV